MTAPKGSTLGGAPVKMAPGPKGAARSEPPAWCRAAVKEALEQASRLLPAQAPLHAFVHHNTLHAFEDMPFERALERAAVRFGAEPYPTESMLARFLEAGSIDKRDVASVVEEEYALPLHDAVLGGLSLQKFLVRRLTSALPLPAADAVRYRVLEGQHTARLHPSVSRGRRLELEALALARYGEQERRPLQRLLDDLWGSVRPAARALSQGAGASTRTERGEGLPLRRRDQLLRLGRQDPDSLSVPHLIRLAAAYLDQGVSSWPMPERERGFYHCFRELYRNPVGVLEKWLLPLAAELGRQADAGYGAEDACIWALERLEIPIEKVGPYVEAVLLSLRGWAGMFHVVEHQPEKCPALAAPARLVDFLAVALILETYAAAFVWAGHAKEASFAELDQVPASQRSEQDGELELAYEGFVLAQAYPLDLTCLLDRGLSGAWLAWVQRLDGTSRRRLLWRALERHHLLALTRGLSDHTRFLARHRFPETKFQAIFCIDDREESYRRHLEEVEPGASTYSYPGFFGVAMRFHAHGQMRSRDLCPVVLSATHVVREIPASGAAQRQSSLSVATPPHRHLGSTTLIRGSVLSLLGVLSIVPLVARVLFPRLFHKREQWTTPATEVQVAREREPEAGELPEGYSDEEMTQVVQRLLGDIGLSSGFSPLVMVIGHGASSVNNPLLAAYGCGATAGGCGGPNARAVCAMANRPAVRERLRAVGIDIPVSTVFVAGMHDTTTDDVVLYAASELAQPAQSVLTEARRALDEASIRNAHERCRLFFQVPTDISAKSAKAIVESRSADLAAARPEFNHAKNSCAIIGRRRFTRGLFLDKRAFLVSSDPTADPDGVALERMIMGSVPVGMGINLEYFFATIDSAKYGSGSKLPHNVSGLMGIMNGHASDLQTGLNSQMVEPHEPIRLVSVVEATPELLLRIVARCPELRPLVENGWIQLVAWQPELDQFYYYSGGQFRLLAPAPAELRTVERSIDAYRGQRGTLPLAHVMAGLEVAV